MRHAWPCKGRAETSKLRNPLTKLRQPKAASMFGWLVPLVLRGIAYDAAFGSDPQRDQRFLLIERIFCLARFGRSAKNVGSFFIGPMIFFGWNERASRTPTLRFFRAASPLLQVFERGLSWHAAPNHDVPWLIKSHRECPMMWTAVGFGWFWSGMFWIFCFTFAMVF